MGRNVPARRTQWKKCWWHLETKQECQQLQATDGIPTRKALSDLQHGNGGRWWPVESLNSTMCGQCIPRRVELQRQTWVRGSVPSLWIFLPFYQVLLSSACISFEFCCHLQYLPGPKNRPDGREETGATCEGADLVAPRKAIGSWRFFLLICIK